MIGALRNPHIALAAPGGGTTGDDGSPRDGHQSRGGSQITGGGSGGGAGGGQHRGAVLVRCDHVRRG
jgi:hypothetical protein